MDPDGPRASWLCRDEAARHRVVDMEGRLKPVRAATFAMLAVALVFAGPWEGWWVLAPLAIAALGFAAADRIAGDAARPEYAIAVAWLVSELLIGSSIALTGGVHSPALGWLAIPIVTLAARFDVRGVAAGCGFTLVLLLAVTLGVDAQAVADRPDRLVHALALIAAVAMLSTALMASDREHRSESVLDGLTGMLNRRSLQARVRELAELSALTHEPVGVVVGDLDHFKAINDDHGHSTGDSVLVDVAYALRKELRAFDLAYRIGGEEFLVLLPGAGADDAATVAERLRSAVARGSHGGLDVTMSLGATSSKGGLFDYARLFAEADAALYEAKRGGRDMVVTAGEEIAERAVV